MKAILTIVFVTGLFLAGFSFSEAGVFDFIKNVFKGGSSNQPAQFFTSQNIPLLDAPLNINPLAGIGGGDITIVQDSALLPVSGPAGSMADVENESKSRDQISIYVVRKGDSLSDIAKMFGVSVNTIVWANDLKRNDIIKIGQVLTILPISGVQYEVQKGDTLVSIAKKFKGDVDEIAQFNDLESLGSLVAGQTIIIPDGEAYPVYSGLIARGGGGPAYDGYYMRPITGGRKTQGLHGYNGVDLATYCGAPIFASASGDVIVGRTYGWNGGYGLYAVISHSNGTQTLYSHLSKIIVERGWHVVQGQVIGYVGSTGNSTGCHVHFEVRGAKNPW